MEIENKLEPITFWLNKENMLKRKPFERNPINIEILEWLPQEYC